MGRDVVKLTAGIEQGGLDPARPLLPGDVR